MRKILLLLLFLLPFVLLAQEPVRNLSIPDTVKPKKLDSLQVDTTDYWKDTLNPIKDNKIWRDGEVTKPIKPRPKKKKFKIRFSDRIEYAFLADLKLTTASGVQTSLLLQKQLSAWRDSLLPASFVKDTTVQQRRKSRIYRAAKIFLIDAPIETIVMATEQDFFGHMSRLREFDLNAKYVFKPKNLFSFSKPLGYVSYNNTNIENEASRQQLSQISASSLEAGGLASDLLAMRWMQRKAVFYNEALHNLRVQFAGIGSVFSVSSSPRTGKSSAEDWLYYTNRQYGHYSEYGYTAKQLKIDYSIATFTNPNLYISLYSVFHHYLMNGVDSMKTPAIKIGYGKYLLPWIRYGFSPLGPEWIPEITLTQHRHVLNIYGRVGTGIFTRSFGGGIRLNNFIRNDYMSLNLHVAFWNQPYLFKNWVNQEILTIGAGGSASLTAYAKLTKGWHYPISAVAQLGYKTRGFMEGEVWQSSPIVRIGLSFALDKDYEQDYIYPEYEEIFTRKERKKAAQLAKKKEAKEKKSKSVPRKNPYVK
jgi:hypothetical protein